MAPKNNHQMNSVIGEGSMFEGKFYIQGSLQIDGRFEGEIKTQDQLVVGETGKVKTDIYAKKVIVGGTVIGNIEAEEDVALLSTGRVFGNITAPRVNIEDGVVVKGEISISAGQKKSIKKVIEESFNAGPKISDVIKTLEQDQVEKKDSSTDA
ncbi:MAG: polymer-forming cytoskeletal protein [Spirochaetota bacterium]|nr:MAG: polymer-forming cytoskeletal protein [Spirochaetota bacterium]